MAKMNWALQKMLKTEKKKKRKKEKRCFAASPEQEDEGKGETHCMWTSAIFWKERKEMFNRLTFSLSISEGHWQSQGLGYCYEQVRACMKCWLYPLALYLFPFLAIYPKSSIKAKLIPITPN